MTVSHALDRICYMSRREFVRRTRVVARNFPRKFLENFFRCRLGNVVTFRSCAGLQTEISEAAENFGGDFSLL